MTQQTTELFRDESYLKSCAAHVTAIDDRGVQFDQTIFYPLSGGQLGDTGELQLSNGLCIPVTDTLKDKTSGELLHQVDDSSELSIGDEVTLQIDWSRRHSLMRFHSCLHLLCALIDAPVNGGSIQLDRARLDFDLQEPVDSMPNPNWFAPCPLNHHATLRVQFGWWKLPALTYKLAVALTLLQPRR